MNSFWKWFVGFFDDNSSGASTMRLMFWLWMITFCFNLTYINIKTGQLGNISEGYIYVTSLLAAAKVGQRIWGEKDITETTTTNPNTGTTTKTSVSGTVFLQSPPTGSILTS